MCVSPWAAAERSCALWERADVKAQGKNRRKTGTEGFYFHGSGSSSLCCDAGSIEVTAAAARNRLTEWLFLGTVGLYLTPLPFVFAVSCSILAGLKKGEWRLLCGKDILFWALGLPVLFSVCERALVDPRYSYAGHNIQRSWNLQIVLPIPCFSDVPNSACIALFKNTVQTETQTDRWLE